MTDLERLDEIRKYFSKIYNQDFLNNNIFSKYLKINRSTVYSWDGIRRDENSLAHSIKVKVCQFFDLDFNIWVDRFLNSNDFILKLLNYQK
ncbi:MAG: hypothetical protein GXN91_04785 [Epsilonproteobacteria bacterium]|nr:hypothetical protein [Campylobacterota bacterium]